MDNRRQTGMFGEELVAKELTRQGYKILDRNWRTQAGELDIIAEKKGILYFVEVRTKSSASFGTPAESITLHKQAKLNTMALLYLQAHGGERECEFIIASVLKDKCELKLIKDMF